MIFKINQLFNGESWQQNQFLEVDSEGRITKISPQGEKFDHLLEGYTFPGLVNAHSHAFQYIMAGLTEYRDPQKPKEDFWSWREKMYQVALQVTPEQIKAIALRLYSRLLENGYTAVVEFHYVHKTRQGEFYEDSMITSRALAEAAQEVGMPLLLVPVFYRKGGFDREAVEDQKRFLFKDTSEYFSYLDNLEGLAKELDFTVGWGLHSLRAADQGEIKEIIQHWDQRGPFHIHIAEQVKEVEQCQKHWGKRPVEWLLENCNLNQNWNLVHATHLNKAELETLAESKAQVVICPSTEANLGDGVFKFCEFNQLQGSWSIGSDSHIGLNPMEELRWLEYQQRLLRRERNPLRTEGLSTGEYLWRKAYIGGEKSFGTGSIGLKEGNIFNAVNLSSDNEWYEQIKPEALFSTLIFSSGFSPISQVITKGQLRVSGGKHTMHENILQNWKVQNCPSLRI